ncbi:hypothetical protein GTX07_35175, partial [Streptomyces sp. SID5606]|nr:hypothetical protein [Streptomyces sp. SID5606]
MSNSRNIQDIFKDLVGDMADSGKEAFDDLLNRSERSGSCRSGNPVDTLAGLPANAFGALAGAVNPAAALAGAANPLAALAGGAGAGHPLAGLGTDAVNQLGGIAQAAQNPLAALTGAAGAGNPLAAVAGAANPLAALSGAGNPLA